MFLRIIGFIMLSFFFVGCGTLGYLPIAMSVGSNVWMGSEQRKAQQASKTQMEKQQEAMRQEAEKQRQFMEEMQKREHEHQKELERLRQGVPQNERVAQQSPQENLLMSAE